MLIWFSMLIKLSKPGVLLRNFLPHLIIKVTSGALLVTLLIPINLFFLLLLKGVFSCQISVLH